MEVDPEAVRAVARRVGEAADKFHQGCITRSARLAPADGRDGGWSAAGAVRSAAAAWGGLVRRLTAASALFGSELLTNTAHIEATDREAERIIIATTAPGARVIDP